MKPKNTSEGPPSSAFSVTVLPFWSTSLNGPPTAAGAGPVSGRNTVAIATISPTAPTMKASSGTSRRLLRGGAGSCAAVSGEFGSGEVVMG